MRFKTSNISSISNIQNFEILFKEYFSPLTYYAIRYVKDDDMAKEIVQAVFLSLWEKRYELHSDTPLRSYLFRAVHNRCMNYLRDKAKFHSKDITEIDYLFKLEKDGSENYEFHELEARIINEINKLPPNCSRIFRLSRFEGKKYKEIAMELGVSVKTVEAQMSKALMILREKLADFLHLIIFFVLFFFER